MIWEAADLCMLQEEEEEEKAAPATSMATGWNHIFGGVRRR
jgi:hypothetical protein